MFQDQTNITQALHGASAILNMVLGSFVLQQRPKATSTQLFTAICGMIALWNISSIFLLSQNHEANWANLLVGTILFLPAFCIHLTTRLTKHPFHKAITLVYILNSSVILTALTKQLVTRDLTNWTASTQLRWLIPIYILEAILLLDLAYQHARQTKELAKTSLSIANCLLVIAGANELLPFLGLTKYPWTAQTIQPIGALGTIGFALLAGYSIANHHSHHTYLHLTRIAAQAVRGIFLFGINSAFYGTLLLFYPALLPPPSNWITFVVTGFTSLSAPMLFPNIFTPFEQLLSRKILGDRMERHVRLLDRAQTPVDSQDLVQSLRQCSQILREDGRANHTAIIALHPDKLTIWENTGALQPTPETTQTLFHFFQINPTRNLLYYQQEEGDQLPHEAEALLAIKSAQAHTALILRMSTENALILCADRIPPTPRDLLVEEQAIQQMGAKLHLQNADIELRKAKQEELLQRMAFGLIKDLHTQVTLPLQTLEKLRKTQPEFRSDLDVGMAIQSLQNIAAYTKAAGFFAIRLKPKRDNLNLHELIATALREKAARAKAKAATITIDCPDYLTIWADRPLFTKAIEALLQNAIEAANFTTPLSITITATQFTPTTTQITIQDTGAGIHPQNLPRVWEPYYTTKHQAATQPGAGLGLTMVKYILDAHQATVHIKSQWGQGTTVTISIDSTKPLGRTTNVKE